MGTICRHRSLAAPADHFSLKPGAGSLCCGSRSESRGSTGSRRRFAAGGTSSSGGSMIQRNSTARGKLRWPPLLWGAIFTVLGGMAAGPSIAAGPPSQLIYRVAHSVFGDIGTYINTIEPVGTGTLVLT